MARNDRVVCSAGTWTQLTNADATGDISVVLLSNAPVTLQATATATAPTDEAGPVELLSRGDGWSEATIAEKFPGVTGAVRLWAKQIGGVSAIVGISHA